MLCQRLDLFSEAFVAIGGSKFKAANHRDRNFTNAKLERRLHDIESSIARYLDAMDTADRQEPTIAKARTERLQDKIVALKEQMRSLKEIEVQLNAAPDKQASLTDPDARSMKTRGTGVVGYNVQTAVDTKHHLIVAHEVTNNGLDRDQLTSMAKLARTEMGVDKLTAVADRGYYKSEEILARHEAGITVFVPKTVTSSATAHGRFGRDDFICNPETNEYRRPAGERLI
jgi:Transposase DDE domain